MADRVRVRVWRVIGAAYRDLMRVLQAMPRLVVVAVLIVLVRAVIELFIPAPPTAVNKIAKLALSAVESFFLTPIFIAVHRFIILEEITRGYELRANQPRFLRFFGWSLVFTGCGAAAMLLQEVMGAARTSPHTIIIVDGIGILVIAVLCLRLTVLYPAIAVDARGATVVNALADTRHNALRILLAFAVAYLPFLVLTMAFASREPGIEHPLPPIASLILSILYAAALPLFIAIASRIFQALADRVIGSPIAGAAPT